MKMIVNLGSMMSFSVSHQKPPHMDDHRRSVVESEGLVAWDFYGDGRLSHVPKGVPCAQFPLLMLETHEEDMTIVKW